MLTAAFAAVASAHSRREAPEGPLQVATTLVAFALTIVIYVRSVAKYGGRSAAPQHGAGHLPLPCG